jgi:hypothetical protein
MSRQSADIANRVSINGTDPTSRPLRPSPPPEVGTAPRTGASRSPLITRDVEVGAQGSPDVAWLESVFDGLRGGAAAETGQHMIDEQRPAARPAELAVDELVEFGQTHRSNLR